MSQDSAWIVLAGLVLVVGTVVLMFILCFLACVLKVMALAIGKVVNGLGRSSS